MVRRRHLEVGYVARAHGLEGELGVKTFDRASSSLLEVPRVVLRKDGKETPFTVVSSRSTAKEVLLRLDGVTDRSAAERWTGSTVLVDREDLEPCAEGEFFLGDLIDLRAITEDGLSLGVVEEIWSTGPVPNLVVRGPGSPELIVPFADPFVPRVDLDEGTVIIRPPEYLE